MAKGAANKPKDASSFKQTGLGNFLQRPAAAAPPTTTAAAAAAAAECPCCRGAAAAAVESKSAAACRRVCLMLRVASSASRPSRLCKTRVIAARVEHLSSAANVPALIAFSS